MSRAIGGYVRRKDRRHEPYGPHLDHAEPLPGKFWHAVMPSGMVITWRDEFPLPQTALPSLRFEEFPEAAGEFLHNMLNPEPPPGPPWTHTFVPPEPIGWDEDGNPIYPEPVPAFTVSEAAR